MAGTGLYFFNRALCEKYARVWAHDAARIAAMVEEFREETGRYPVATSGLELWSALGNDSRRDSIIEDELIHYWSDGSTYLLLLKPAGPGAISRGTLIYEIRDGEWHTWPECLEAPVRARLRESFSTGATFAQADDAI